MEERRALVARLGRHRARIVAFSSVWIRIWAQMFFVRSHLFLLGIAALRRLRFWGRGGRFGARWQHAAFGHIPTPRLEMLPIFDFEMFSHRLHLPILILTEVETENPLFRFSKIRRSQFSWEPKSKPLRSQPEILGPTRRSRRRR